MSKTEVLLSDEAQATIMLPLTALQPNDYNPNHMTDERFAELVEEVRHLGRLPKPVVARPNGDGQYVIVDGEHGWRAAQEVDLTEIAVEVVEADDFEARRQTYKRNQHGEHNPVLLGRMFRQMMDERDLSQRALAKEIAVSEGTIRNVLLYAKAAELRNSYASGQDDTITIAEISDLSIRQIRAYCGLPDGMRDYWLRDGKDLNLLEEIACGNAPPRFKKNNVQMPYEEWDQLVDFGFGPVLDKYGFSRVADLWELWAWGREHSHVIGGKPYLVALAQHGWLSTQVSDQIPVVETEKPKGWPVWGKQPYKVALSIEDFEDVLDRADKLGIKTLTEIIAIIQAKMRLIHGDDFDFEDPRVGLIKQIVEKAPEFIREANLSLADKLVLAQFDEDLPAEILEEVKREATELLVARDQIISGEIGLPDNHQAITVMSNLTAVEAIQRVCGQLGEKELLQERGELFADRDKLMTAVMAVMMNIHRVREKKIGNRPTREVLHERLDALPWPEFRFLAAHITGHEDPALSFWIEAIEDETSRVETS